MASNGPNKCFVTVTGVSGAPAQVLFQFIVIDPDNAVVTEQLNASVPLMNTDNREKVLHRIADTVQTNSGPGFGFDDVEIVT